MNAREQLRVLAVEHPELDQSELASIIGVSRQRVHQLVHCPVDPIPVVPRNNNRRVVSQQALVRLVEAVQRVMRESPEACTWKEVARLAKITGNVGSLLRGKEPTFYQVISQTLDARRSAKKGAPPP